MNWEESFTVSPEVLVAHLQGEAVLLHMDSKRYYRLNETAASIWRGLEHRERLPGIVNLLCQDFDVPREQAERETERVVTDLLERGLLSRLGRGTVVH